MDNNNQNTNPYGSSDPLSGQNSYGNTNPADNNMYQNPTDPTANTTGTYNAGSYNNQGNIPQGNPYSAPENNVNQPYQNTSGSYNYSGSEYYNQPEPPQSSNGFLIASMILGILSLVLGCCYGIGIVFGIISIILAFVGKKNNGGTFGGMGLAGIICSCIGILLGVLFWVLFLIGLSQMSSSDIDALFNSANFIW